MQHAPGTLPPALIGDGNGVYRVHLTGNSGTGKSTVGSALASTLGVPYIALDELFWQPGWKPTSKNEFQKKIRKALENCDKGWVVDGKFSTQGGAIVSAEATDIIWLDPPLLLYFPRIFIRTLLRLFRLRPSCSPGCQDTFQEAFTKEGILWWCLSHHWSVRRENAPLMEKFGIRHGSNVKGRKMRRIGGWGTELNRWLRDVKDMVCNDQRRR